MASSASTAIEKLISWSSIIGRHHLIARRVQVLLTGLDGGDFALMIALEDSKTNALMKEAAFVAAGQAGLVHGSAASIGEVCDELMDRLFPNS